MNTADLTHSKIEPKPAYHCSLIARFAYLAVLFVLAVMEWRLLYTARFLSSADFTGQVNTALFLSLHAAVVVVVLWFRERDFLRNNAIPTILYLVAASPLTVIAVLIFYKNIIGPVVG